VQEFAGAIGIHYADDEELKVGEKELERDRKRWELDRPLRTDYQDRVREES